MNLWFFLLTLFLITETASSATLYVGATGDYACDGSEDDETIQRALDNATLPGDIVHLNASTYNITGRMYANYSFITIEGEGDSTILLLEGNASAIKIPQGTYVMNLLNDSITFQNIKYDGNFDNQKLPSGASYLEFLHADYGTSGITIQNCSITGSRCDGIELHGENHIVKNNHLYDNIHDHITGSYSYSEISNNIIECTVRNCNAGIRKYYGSGNTISNNTIADNGVGVLPFGIEFRPYNNNNASGDIITGNTIKGAYSYNIYLDSADTQTDQTKMSGIRIKNNIVHSSADRGILYTQGIYIHGVYNNMTIENNVFYATGSGIVVTGKTGGNITARNNIISDVLYDGFNVTVENCGLTSSYNNVYSSGRNDYKNIISGTGDISSDPLFYNVAVDDFHLNSTVGTWNGAAWKTMSADSPCINAGDPTTSYSNEPSPNGGVVNMGAYGNTPYASKSSWSYNASHFYTNVTYRFYTDGTVSIVSRTPTQTDTDMGTSAGGSAS